MSTRNGAAILPLLDAFGTDSTIEAQWPNEPEATHHADCLRTLLQEIVLLSDKHYTLPLWNNIHNLLS